ncbi:hypothetical protein L1049_009035 [Liquidambar formosana]|uniref:High mobility group B protein 6 n=1 Tax=Liquidambar formosana TaxID=63359 RepID=A0AAP0X641_LIQFO
MLTAQNPVAGNQKPRPKSGRKPLQPKNCTVNLIVDSSNPKPKPSKWIDISPIKVSNKENHPNYSTPIKIESFDASLAEELSAIRKRVERLRLDREKTEKMLRERDLVLEMWMKELEQKGEAQNELELEVDRLYRLKELRTSCMRVSPLRSLREKEVEKKFKESQSQGVEMEDREESMDESALQSPTSESSEIVTDI